MADATLPGSKALPKDADESPPPPVTIITSTLVMTIVFTYALCGVFAYYLNAWFTLFAPLVGVALTYLLRWPLGHFLLSAPVLRACASIRGWILPWILSFLESLCLIWGRHENGSKAFAMLRRSVSLYGRLWALILKREIEAARRMIVAGLLDPGAYFSRWLAIGFLFRYAVPLPEGSEAVRQLEFGLDICLFIVFGLSAFRTCLTDDGRDASRELRDPLIEAIHTELKEVQLVGDLGPRSSQEEVRRLRENLKPNHWKISGFEDKFRTVLESGFNIAVVSVLLLVITLRGGALAGLGLLVVSVSLLTELLVLSTSEKETGRLYARRNAKRRLAEDTRQITARDDIAPEGAVEASIKADEEKLQVWREFLRILRRWHHTLFMVCYLTIFAIATTFSFMAARSGDLQPRLALLFMFSMIGLWISQKRFRDALRDIAYDFDTFSEDLEKVFEAIEGEEERRLHTPTNPPEILTPTSGEICFGEIDPDTREFTHGTVVLEGDYGHLLTIPGALTIESTITFSERVMVHAAPGTGSSLLFAALAGKVAPKSGCITIGGVPIDDERVRAGEWVKLVEDSVPAFDNLRIWEIFESYCGRRLDDEVIDNRLRDVGLIPPQRRWSRKFIGAQTLIGNKGDHLDPEKLRLLNLAVHLAAIDEQKGGEYEGTFHPNVIIVDGIHKIRRRELRARILGKFKALCDKVKATMISVASHYQDLDDSDYVLSIYEPEEFTEGQEIQRYEGNLVIGGIHSRRKSAMDQALKDQYAKHLRHVPAQL